MVVVPFVDSVFVVFLCLADPLKSKPGSIVAVTAVVGASGDCCQSL